MLQFDSTNRLMKLIAQKRLETLRNLESVPDKVIQIVFQSLSQATFENKEKKDTKTLNSKKGCTHIYMCAQSSLSNKYELFKRLRTKKYPYMPLTYLSLHEMPRRSQMKWFLKPAAESCGDGIRMGKGFDEAAITVQSFRIQEPVMKYVIQEMVSNPLLVQSCKCDFRVYLFYDEWSGSSFLCRTVGVRVAQSIYRDDCYGRARHLTNVSQGARIFPSYQWQDKQGYRWETIWSAIWDATTDLLARIGILSLAPRTTPRPPRTSYCLLGLDFISDAKGNIFLLELNDSPQFGGCLQSYPDWDQAQLNILQALISEVIEPLFGLAPPLPASGPRLWTLVSRKK